MFGLFNSKYKRVLRERLAVQEEEVVEIVKFNDFLTFYYEDHTKNVSAIKDKEALKDYIVQGTSLEPEIMRVLVGEEKAVGDNAIAILDFLQKYYPEAVGSQDKVTNFIILRLNFTRRTRRAVDALFEYSVYKTR